MIQATGRDVFSEAVLRLEDAGNIPVLSIHDEIVLEVPTGTDPQTIDNIMAEPVVKRTKFAAVARVIELLPLSAIVYPAKILALQPTEVLLECLLRRLSLRGR